MGVTHQLPERDKYIYTQEYLGDRLAVMMGGRAAEILVLNTSTSGAEMDLKEATHLARKMVLDWGMSEKLGTLSLGEQREHVFLGEEIGRPRKFSEQTARLVDEEVKVILDNAYRRASSHLQSNRKTLDSVAKALMEREEITGEEVTALFEETEPTPER